MKRIITSALILVTQAAVANSAATPAAIANFDIKSSKSGGVRTFANDPQTQLVGNGIRIKDQSLQKMSFGQDRGGGDPCEDRIKEIRDDIRSWIQKGGPQGLTLPGSVTATQYSQAMLTQISRAKILCVGQGDPGYPVLIDNVPKFCRFDRSGAVSQITCDFAKFDSARASDQYVLVHHEYAGLAGIENPDKADSQYGVSNQISGYLQEEKVLKLAIKPAPQPPKARGKGLPCDQQIALERDILNPAVEKILVPNTEGALKKLYAVQKIKIKSMSSSYALNKSRPDYDYVTVETKVLDDTGVTTSFSAYFPLTARFGNNNITEEVLNDNLGREQPPICVGGVRFISSPGDIDTLQNFFGTFGLFNTETKVDVGMITIDYFSRTYLIQFPK